MAGGFFISLTSVADQTHSKIVPSSHTEDRHQPHAHQLASQRSKNTLGTAVCSSPQMPIVNLLNDFPKQGTGLSVWMGACALS